MSRVKGRIPRELVRQAWVRAYASGTESNEMAGLERARSLLKSSPRFRQVLMHSGIPRERKEELLQRVGRLPAASRELVLVMAQRRCLHLFGAVLREFRALYEEALHEKEVLVCSAVRLSGSEAKLLERAVSRGLGRNVRLSVKVRKDLLGGLMLRVDDRIVDGSLKGAFARLAAHMLAPRSQGVGR